MSEIEMWNVCFEGGFMEGGNLMSGYVWLRGG